MADILARGGAVEWGFESREAEAGPASSSKINAGALTHGLGRIGYYSGFEVSETTGEVTGAGGIASAEAFGTPTVTAAFLATITGAGGIASGEAFGSPVFSADGTYTVTDAGGIDTGEAFGSPTLDAEFGSGASAAAVWDHELEEGLSAGDLLRVILAAVSGKSEGIGTSTERYKSVDGSKDRITVTFDSAGNRETVTLDASE